MTGTDTISQFVDTILDEYVVTKKKIRVDFFKYLQSEDIDRKSINEYASGEIHFVTDLLAEVDGALDGDQFLVEAYGCYKKSELREFKCLLERFISDVEKYKESKKIVRRKKKKSPEQLVRALHLIQKPVILGEEKYTPVSKTEIIDAKSVFLINIKTNDILFLTGKKLSCSGAKIINYDEELSGIKKIKKIDQTIETVLSSTNINCSKIFDDLPNKARSVPKTVSPNYFPLKVIQ
jgi:hypothetical protein